MDCPIGMYRSPFPAWLISIRQRRKGTGLPTKAQSPHIGGIQLIYPESEEITVSTTPDLLLIRELHNSGGTTSGSRSEDNKLGDSLCPIQSAPYKCTIRRGAELSCIEDLYLFCLRFASPRLSRMPLSFSLIPVAVRAGESLRSEKPKSFSATLPKLSVEMLSSV